MTIDVLMPVYGTPLEWIREAVASIRKQTDKDFTLVIVDDHNSKGHLRDFIYEQATCVCKTSIIRTEKNRGVAAALDAGLKMCTGDLIIRMDSDDIAYPSLVASHRNFFTQHPDRHICGVQIKLSSSSRTWSSHHPGIITRESAFHMKDYWFVNHPGVAYRRKTVLSVGGYGNTPNQFAEDYALWIKFLKAGYVIYNTPEELIWYRVHQNISGQKRKSAQWLEFLQNQKQSLYV